MVASEANRVEPDSNHLLILDVKGMNSIFTLIIILNAFFISNCAFSQINTQTIGHDIDTLIQLSKKEFKGIVGDKTHEKDGETYYKVDFTIEGASDITITIDKENSRSFYAYFELSTIILATSELEKLTKSIEEIAANYGLTRSSGTDVKYEKFKATRIEFDSENIDVLGKHPSFTLGILKNSSTIELILTEPLWK
jgi:hypothetical protein